MQRKRPIRGNFSFLKPISMRRKFTCSVTLILLCFFANAQLTFEATPEYGKLWDITYDQTTPNRVYGISLVNHIMVSNDNGKSWGILYSYPSDKSYLSQLKIAPGGKALSFTIRNNPDPQKNALYILDLATNSITHTFIPPNWTDNPTIMSYDIHSETDSVILMNTSYSVGFAPFTKVFYTKNAGTDWNEIYFSGSNDDVQINSGFISPANPAKLFLTRGLGPSGVNGSLLVSTDTGTIWVKKLEGKVFDQMAFNPSNPDDIWMGTGIDFVEADEAMYHSTNGGSNWRLVTLPLHGIEYGLNNFTKIAFDPTDNKTIWALEENEYLKTTDGGAHWNSTMFEPNDPTYYYGTNITINPFNNQQLFITSDGWPQYSADGGITLTQAKNPFYNVTSLGYGNYKSQKHLYYGSQGGYLEKNYSTGVTMPYLIESPFIVNGHSRTVIPDSAVNGRVFIYTPGDGFVSTSVLAISDDYGATVQPIPADDFSAFIEKVQRYDNNTYWASFSSFGSGTLFKLDVSDAGNPSSTQITTPTSLPVKGIYVVPSYPDSVFIVQGATFYSTSDGGNTWHKKRKGLEAFNDDANIIWDLQANPLNPSQFVIATDKGVYTSRNSGNNWVNVLEGIDIRRANFSNVVDGQLIAATHSAQYTDCQLFFSPNSGGKWDTIPFANIAWLQSNTISYRFFEDSINVYFATPDIGVVKYKLDVKSVLPLHLLSFTGTIKNDNAQLQWRTTAEQNLKGYDVERSTDTQQFNRIGSIAAANRPGSQTYNYTDDGFAVAVGKENNTVYYRLKMVDIDGKYRYSNTIKLSRAGSGIVSLSAYPNPVVNTLNLHFVSSSSGNYNISITGVTGKQYYNGTYKATQGESVTGIPVNQLAAGVYMVTVKDAEGKTTILKFVK